MTIHDCFGKYACFYHSNSINFTTYESRLPCYTPEDIVACILPRFIILFASNKKSSARALELIEEDMSLK